MFLTLDHIKRIIFELNVKKVFGIEFGELEKQEIKTSVRNELKNKGIDLDEESINKITDTALSKISGVAYKGQYFEEIVSYALKDLGVSFLSNLSRIIGQKRYQLDFAIELKENRIIGIEAAYSDRKYLSKQKISQTINQLEAYKQVDNISHFLIITNTEVKSSDKEALKRCNPSIEIIENVISPDGILAELQHFYRDIDHTKKGSHEQ